MLIWIPAKKKNKLLTIRVLQVKFLTKAKKNYKKKAKL